MDMNILSGIRNSKGFNRGVAILVIVAIVGLLLERVIYYTLHENGVIAQEDVVEKLNRMAPDEARRMGLAYKPRPDSNETKFSHTAQNIKEKLAALNNKLDESSINQLTRDVSALRDELQSLDLSIREEFAKTAQHIEDKKLPAIIQQRQKDAVAKYEKEFGTLMNKLAAIDAANTISAKQAALQDVKSWMSKQQFKRSQQAFDPNQLPFDSVKPNPENKPKLTEQEFARAGLFNHPQQKLAALGDFTFDKLPGATDPAYLVATDEVVLSDAIRQQAQDLNYDPVQIYHWVLNNIEWLPTWGSIQDSDITLGSKKGNAMDIASLLAALLRASQIPVRYVHGTIDVPVEQFKNWAGGFTSTEAALSFASSGGIPTTGIISGGQISKVRMEHVWVEAAIDYAPSRGAKNIDADSWVQMDASYKQYEYLPGLDVAQIANINGEQLAGDFLATGTVNEAEGWVSGFDPAVLQTAQTQAQTALQDYITNNMTNPTVGDVIGGRKTIIKQYPVLPSSLQNKIVVIGKRYGALPSALQQKMVFSLGRDVLGYPINPITVPWVKLNNHKVTLSFKPATPADEQTLLSLLPEGEITDISQLPTAIPAYLINVIPELKVDGVLLQSGNSMTLGYEIDFGFDTQLVGRSIIAKRYTLAAGSFLSIAAVGGSVSTTALNQLQTRLAQTRDTLQTSDASLIGALTREELLGDMFQAGTLGYYAQYISLSNLASLQNRARFILAGGTGSFGYEPDVDYFFGLPRAIKTGGIALNKPIINITGTLDNNAEQTKNYNLQIGILSSTLEYITPEQMFTNTTNLGEAVSAVKALQKATQQGQRIYQLTAQNITAALPNIHHDSATMDEIRNAVHSGKEVITHTDAIQVPGWSGAGYIIVDNETGSGAYKISGGTNGGYNVLQEAQAQILKFMSISSAILSIAGKAALSILLDIISTILNIYDAIIHCSSLAAKIYASLAIAFLAVSIGSGIAIGLALGSAFLGSLVGIASSYVFSKYLDDLKAYQCN